MRATDLTTEYQHDPIGLGTTSPRFSWRLEATGDPGDAADVQLAYEIEVTSGDAVVWNTGRVEGAAQILIPYTGQALVSRQHCSWAVRVWSGSADGAGDAGDPGPWSEPASFGIGLLQPEEWAGTAWIGPPAPPEPTKPSRLPQRRGNSADRPSPLLRKEFDIAPDQDIADAHLYCSALGIYELEINGVPVSGDRLRPGFTAYDHRVQFQTYDVSKLLVPGRNAIGVTLADGWWRGRVGVFRKPDNWGTQVAFIAQLESGGETLVRTDPTWTTTEGGVRRACLFHGEEFDARLEPDGWTVAGFDDAAWRAATVVDGPTERLIPQVGPAVRVIDRVPAQRVFRTPSGETVVDFGCNIATSHT